MITFPNLSSTDVGLIVAGTGKIFIEIADSMPMPDADAGYFTRWFYAFMQKLASNGMKAEAARSGGSITVNPPKAEPEFSNAEIKPSATASAPLSPPSEAFRKGA